MKRVMAFTACLLLSAIGLEGCGGDGVENSASSNDGGTPNEGGPKENDARADLLVDATVQDVSTIEGGADAGSEISGCIAACAVAAIPACKTTCETVCQSGKCIVDPNKPFPWAEVNSVTCSDVSVRFRAKSGGVRGCVIR